jgi:bifunctional ADP-heptose synthase (sugar kinase/adenylyltransferase)
MDTQQQKKFTVLLIGDSCIDEYHFGTVDRISPEAPVPVFKLTKKISKPGMAANVKENLLMLGLDVCFVTKGNSTKIRLIDAKSKQHIVRVDDDIKSDPLTINEISIDLHNIDAVVVSDYNKGLVTYDLVKSIRKKYLGPIFIDTKKHDLKEFEGCVVKINETEFSKANSTTSSLIVTQGNKGCTYNGVQFPARETEVVDVTGCGDTFLAALVFMFLETNDIVKAIEFANKAASVTVQHLGVYAPKLEEIK